MKKPWKNKSRYLQTQQTFDYPGIDARDSFMYVLVQHL